MADSFKRVSQVFSRNLSKEFLDIVYGSVGDHLLDKEIPLDGIVQVQSCPLLHKPEESRIRRDFHTTNIPLELDLAQGVGQFLIFF